MQTTVADTSALISLAVPAAVATYDTTTNPDPLQLLLTSCTVYVPTPVETELRTTAQYTDIHAAAATNVLAASAHYHVEDPLQRSDTQNSLPAYGLDEGETAGIVLANARDVDGFLTDEFAGTNFALIHAALTGPQIVPAPRLVCDYARNEHLTTAETRQLLSIMGQHRSWGSNPYVQQLLKTL
jgi:predicted nucleic acid-binding protein